MFKKAHFIAILLISTVLFSCSKHQKLLKSTDNELKYQQAMAYYDKGDYYRALQVFDQLIPVYRGTTQSEELLFRYAYAYYYERDYIMASYYFNRFTATFPRSEKTEEAAFQSAYCKYLDSPRSTLDQTVTKEAINEFQVFINRFPYGEKAKEATKLIDELRMKLQLKDYNIANLYFKIEDYQAAIVSYRNLMKDYPDTDFKEEVMYKIILAAYNFASMSIVEKRQERFEDARKAYYDFIAVYPESRYLSEINKINNRVSTELSKYENAEI
ncbi:MAG: outer membrane protein assembly factor BamD [Bacteroidales bacterium]|nr:outer membrane protein assembly factor BamD [Bacteroidales bacterium]